MLVVVLLWGAAVARVSSASAATFLLLIGAAFLPYAALFLRPPEPTHLQSLRYLLGVTVAAGLPFVFAEPLLSDDIYRFVWDGRVLLHTGDPYAFAPAAPELSGLRDSLWTKINYPEIATIYPPLAQLYFAAGARVASATWPLQLFALLAHVVVVLVLSRRSLRAAWQFALNPLAIVESASSGHYDVLVGLGVLFFAWALADARLLSAVASALAVSALKLFGVALAPLIALRRPWLALLGLVLCVLPALPLLNAGSGSAAGIGEYGRRWRGNDGGFALVEEISYRALAAWEIQPEVVRVPVLRRVAGTAFDPRASMSEKKPIANPTHIDRRLMAGALARAVVGALLLGIIVMLLAWSIAVPTAVRVVVLSALLLMPQVHPWYLLWLLPLELAQGKRVALLWSVAVLIAYAPLDGWLARREWNSFMLSTWLEYLIVGVAIVAELVRSPARVPPKSPKS